MPEVLYYRQGLFSRRQKGARSACETQRQESEKKLNHFHPYLCVFAALREKIDSL
jgi:hypothetical protein